MCSTRIIIQRRLPSSCGRRIPSSELHEGARTERADDVYMHAVYDLIISMLLNDTHTQSEITGGWSGGDDVGVVIVVERIFYFGKRLIRDDKSKLGVRWFASSAWMCVSRLGGEGDVSARSSR